MAKPQYMTGNAPRMHMVPCALAQAFADGDLLAIVSDLAIPASAFTWTADLATTQTNFAAAFLGVCAQTKAANTARPYGNSEDNAIGYDAGGTSDWEFDCVADQYNVGDFVGPAKDTGDNILSQKVVAVATEALAIGRVTKSTGAAATRVRVSILSKLNPAARQS